MENKKSLTMSILDNIGDRSQVNLDCNSFIMVPTNHPKINEILSILNNFESEYKSKGERKANTLNNTNNKKPLITANDILKLNQEKIITPINSIITPMAKDYIKQKQIEIIFTQNKEK